MKDSIIIVSTWEEFIIELIHKSWIFKREGSSYNYFSVVWQFGSLNYDLTFIDEIYPGKEAKKSYLMNAYFNKESLVRAKERLSLKKNTSVNVSFMGKEKTNTTQDHCMVSMVVFKENKKYRATIFYRTTEICRKFLFDLKFLKEEIFSFLEIPDCEVTFIFAKLSLSYAFLHTVFILGNNVKYTIGDEYTKEFWKGYLQFLNKMLLVNQRGSILKSHWRHFQTFKNHPVFSDIIKRLKGVTDGRTNKFSTKDTSKS